jgi:hypothetical protein
MGIFEHKNFHMTGVDNLEKLKFKFSPFVKLLWLNSHGKKITCVKSGGKYFAARY